VINNEENIQMPILQKYKNTLERIQKNKTRNKKNKKMQIMQKKIYNEDNTEWIEKRKIAINNFLE